MSRINRTIAFSNEDYQLLVERFGNITEGVRRCVDIYKREDNLIRAADIDLRCRFTISEMNLMFFALKNNVVQGPLRMSVEGLKISIFEHPEIEQYIEESRVRINLEELLNKVNELSPMLVAGVYALSEKTWSK